MWVQFDQKIGRMLGFKFVLPSKFPHQAPIAFLDEPINKQVIEFSEYVRDGNVLDFGFLREWNAQFKTSEPKFNLQTVLIHVNGLYTEQPPIPFDEL